MNITYVGGAGRLGYPLALWSSQFFNVTIADTNWDAVIAINNGDYKTNEPLYESYDPALSNMHLSATTNVEQASRCANIIFVIVPTPSRDDGSFSTDCVLEACQEIGKGLSDSRVPYPAVVIVSTVNPGDCDGPIRDKLERFSDRKCGVDFDLLYSPEFVAQGSIMRDFARPDFVLLGSYDPNDPSIDIYAYYQTVTEEEVPIYSMSLVSAEIAKLGLNVAVTAKMTMANMLAWLCHLTPGADAQDVLFAIGSDRRIGHRYFSPGAIFGGPCFPRDGRALTRAFMNKEVDPSFSMMIDYLRRWQFSATMYHVGAYSAFFNLQGRTPLILGMTYKPGVDITEEALGPMVEQILINSGLPVLTHDPAFNTEQELLLALSQCGLIVLCTPWGEYKVLEELDLEDKVIFDLWGFLNEERLQVKHYIRFGRHDGVRFKNPFTGEPDVETANG